MFSKVLIFGDKMMTSLKQSTISFTNPDILMQKSRLPTSQFGKFSSIICRKTDLSIQKPLHITSDNVKGLVFNNGLLRERKSLIKCEAYEADRSQPIEHGTPEVPKESARRVKIGIYFATWWALNVVFNIYNKKVLTAFPFPWLTSTLSLAMGSLIMLVSWATRIAEAPKTIWICGRPFYLLLWHLQLDM